MFFALSTALANPVTPIEGPRPARDLMTAANGRLEAFSRCFDSKKDGVVKFRIKTEPDGLVSDAQYSTTVDDKALLQCLVSESMRMRMPKRDPNEGTTLFEWVVSIETLHAPIPPEFSPGVFKVIGSDDPDAIETMVKTQLKQFKYCYEKELPRDPQLKGSYDLQITLDAYGTVALAEAKNVNFPNSTVIECTKSRFQRIRFPPAPENESVRIYYPFAFEPPTEEDGDAPKP